MCHWNKAPHNNYLHCQYAPNDVWNESELRVLGTRLHIITICTPCTFRMVFRMNPSQESLELGSI